MRRSLTISAEPKIQAASFKFSEMFPNLVQAFSTRKGGFSEGPFRGLNLGLHSGDDKACVQKNRSLFFKSLNISESRAVFPQQVHSCSVQAVSEPGTAAECDALITNTKNLFLTIQTADCFPVFLFDPVKQAAGIVHSGWRGTAQNITGRTVKLMSEIFACSPDSIFAGIGPGVQQDCYQVDQTAADFFGDEFLSADGLGHFKLDVQGAIKKQLLDAGIPLKNLEIENTCTHCAEDLYYSYRRDGDKCGRMMGVIGIRSTHS